MTDTELTVAKSRVREIVISMYVGEPCRICGKTITRQHLEDGAVFAGYSRDNKARSAHAACWQAAIPQGEWAHP